ncbi:hypothetical protein B0O99DRAFT_609415 [Bisporella sp. PMI_857]|nr:hypothetical protein B0O99DRAFT_609415 [Bisporella sp. PMI_857]
MMCIMKGHMTFLKHCKPMILSTTALMHVALLRSAMQLIGGDMKKEFTGKQLCTCVYYATMVSMILKGTCDVSVV